LTAGDGVRFHLLGHLSSASPKKLERTGNSTFLWWVGDVYAAGKGVKQLQDELTTLYKPQLQNSEVVVTLETVAIPVVVSGEVRAPGKVVFERPVTILEAIMEAGGFTDFADLKRVSLIRLIRGEHDTQIFDLIPALHGMPTRAVYVRGGDVIYVRAKTVNF
jgi:polysaccharide export outer membrane protein